VVRAEQDDRPVRCLRTTSIVDLGDERLDAIVELAGSGRSWCGSAPRAARNVNRPRKLGWRVKSSSTADEPLFDALGVVEPIDADAEPGMSSASPSSRRTSDARVGDRLWDSWPSQWTGHSIEMG
jgi:hypothetical protein